MKDFPLFLTTTSSTIPLPPAPDQYHITPTPQSAPINPILATSEFPHQSYANFNIPSPLLDFSLSNLQLPVLDDSPQQQTQTPSPPIPLPFDPSAVYLDNTNRLPDTHAAVSTIALTTSNSSHFTPASEIKLDTSIAAPSNTANVISHSSTNFVTTSVNGTSHVATTNGVSAASSTCDVNGSCPLLNGVGPAACTYSRY